MTKKETKRSARDGNTRAIFWFHENTFNPPGRFLTLIATSGGVSAANQESAANPAPAAISRIEIDGYES